MTNPFSSKTYTQIWLKHFKAISTEQVFKSIKGVSFYKSKYLPLFINVGKNLTKGIFYSIDYQEGDYKDNVFLLYDIPEYFNVEDLDTSRTNLRLKSVFQYEGFLMDISSFNDVETYIDNQFSSKNRREFRSNKRRLETCFDISYSFINEEISQVEFDIIFKSFYELLSKRFSEKQTNYHHLNPVKWNYYKELVFEMLKEKRASFLIIYNEDTPIGITLNFHSDSILFETITAFDPDYYKFSIGKLSIIKLLEWCFENNYKISDFSKGYFDYKDKWGNRKYHFDYHILYDSKSLKATIIAYCIELVFKLKLFLRKKNFNVLYRKLLFVFKRNNGDSKLKFDFEKLDDFTPSSNDVLIDYDDESYEFLKKFVFTFLFANPEPASNLKVYKIDNKDSYVITGSKKSQKINFTF